MKERPILMSGDMVKAILEGRKTMTRRLVKNIPHWEHCGKDIMDWALSGVYTDENGRHWLDVQTDVDDNSHKEIKCPYGVPGDRLWVREAWKCQAFSHHTPTNGPEEAEYTIGYKVGYGIFPHCRTVKFNKPVDNAWQKTRDGWRPSIHMPRWASRITLEITNVRVERVGDISEADAVAEGFEANYLYNRETHTEVLDRCAIDRFFCAWGSIYPGSCERNDWVWVIEFNPLLAGKKG